MRNQDSVADGSNLPGGRGKVEDGAVKTRSDATKAGGGNLHRGRGTTAWGREDGEQTEATRQRPAGATSTGDGEPLPGAEKKEATT